MSDWATADEPPTARLQAGTVTAIVDLPDATTGHYQGPRFDWSGMVAEVACNGHHYFGPSNHKAADPNDHDANALGPAEEFGMEKGPLGFDGGKPGDVCLKIGVGTMVRPDDQPYEFFGAYKIKPLPWSVDAGPASVTFAQTANVGEWGYHYTKRVEVMDEPPRLLIHHTLSNTGKRPILTDWYVHNFISIDGDPTGPAYTIQFPFAIVTNEIKSIAQAVAIDGKIWHFRQPPAPGQAIYAELSGEELHKNNFCAVVADARAKTQVTINGDNKPSAIHVYCTDLAICPEMFAKLNITPGNSFSWTTTYRFEALPVAEK